MKGQATEPGHSSGTVTRAAHSSGPGGAPEDLHPQRQSLRSGSLSVRGRADFGIYLYRISFCFYPDDNERGWVLPTVLVSRSFPSVSPAFF